MVNLKASFPTAKWTTVLQIWGSRKVTSLVGGARYFNLENRRNPELEKVPWNLDTHEDRTHNGVDILIVMSSALTTRPPSCLRRCKKKDANKREPKTWKGWNAKWRNDFDFASSLSQFRIFAFSIVRFRFHNFAFWFRLSKSKGKV